MKRAADTKLKIGEVYKLSTGQLVQIDQIFNPNLEHQTFLLTSGYIIAECTCFETDVRFYISENQLVKAATDSDYLDFLMKNSSKKIALSGELSVTIKDFEVTIKDEGLGIVIKGEENIRNLMLALNANFFVY